MSTGLRFFTLRFPVLALVLCWMLFSYVLRADSVRILCCCVTSRSFKHFPSRSSRPLPGRNSFLAFVLFSTAYYTIGSHGLLHVGARWVSLSLLRPKASTGVVSVAWMLQAILRLTNRWLSRWCLVMSIEHLIPFLQYTLSALGFHVLGKCIPKFQYGSLWEAI